MWTHITTTTANRFAHGADAEAPWVTMQNFNNICQSFVLAPKPDHHNLTGGGGGLRGFCAFGTQLLATVFIEGVPACACNDGLVETICEYDVVNNSLEWHISYYIIIGKWWVWLEVQNRHPE